MTTIDQLTEKTRKAYAAGKFHVALRDSARLIDELRQQINTMELRATIWEKKKNVAQELKSALLLIDYDRQNSGAYLRAAKIYSKQEKLQETIDMLQKALSTSPDRKKAIKRQLYQARERLKHRVDFITAAPYDITCHILSYLTSDEAFVCLNVCHRWREVLLNCPVLWEEVAPVYGYWYDRFDMVPTISHHVKSLFLQEADSDFISRGFKFLKESQFTRLNYLHIVNSIRDNPLLGDPLYEALHQVANTLTSFTLHAVIEFSLGKLLTICPKLTTVDLTVFKITEWTTGLPTTTPLTDVKITTNFPQNHNDLIPFFRCAPCLQKIDLVPRDRKDGLVDIIPLIEHCCPNLSFISNDYGGFITKFNWAKEDYTLAGLEQMSLGDVRSTIPLLSRLERATNSLRALRIRPIKYDGDSTWADWRPLSSFIMHKLTYLNIIAGSNSVLYLHLPNMLHSYPALELLKLTCFGSEPLMDVSVSDDIFAAIAKLETLHELNLNNLPLCGQGFHQLIKKHVVQESSALKSLTINASKTPIDVLFDIARIRSLEKLRIDHYFFKRDSVYEIDEFARLVADLPCLKDLCFGRSLTLTDNAARSLASSRSLETLDLHNPESLTEEEYTILEHLFAHRR